MTCNGPLQTDCLTCDTSIRAFESSNSTCQPILIINDTYCKDKHNRPLSTSSTGICLHCYDYQVFLANKKNCDHGDLVRYFEWSVRINWVDDSNYENIFIDFFLSNQELVFQNVQSPPLIPGNVSERFDIFANGISIKSQLMIHSINRIQIRLTSDERKQDKILIKISNNRVLQNNIIWQNTTNQMILVNLTKDIDIPDRYRRDELIGKSLIAIGERIAGIVRIILNAIGLLFCLISIIDHTKYFSGYIQLVQIIDLMGRFYHLPFRMSPLIDFCFEMLSQISKPLNFGIQILTQQQMREPNPFIYKASEDYQSSRYILQESPIIIPIYLFIFFLQKVLDITTPSKSSKWISNLKNALEITKNFLFQINFVQYNIFIGTALAGSCRGITVWKYLDKAIAFILLTDYSNHICTLMKIASEKIVVKEKGFISTSPPKEPKSRISISLSNNHKILNNGLAESSLVHRYSRFMNIIFYLKVVLISITIPNLQSKPHLCLALLLIGHLFLFISFLWIAFDTSPFQNFLAAFQKWFYLPTFMCFMGYSTARFLLNYESKGIEYLIITMLFSWIVTLGIGLMKDLISLKGMKKKNRSPNSSEIGSEKKLPLGTKSNMTNMMQFSSAKKLNVKNSSSLENEDAAVNSVLQQELNLSFRRKNMKKSVLISENIHPKTSTADSSANRGAASLLKPKMLSLKVFNKAPRKNWIINPQSLAAQVQPDQTTMRNQVRAGMVSEINENSSRLPQNLWERSRVPEI